MHQERENYGTCCSNLSSQGMRHMMWFLFLFAEDRRPDSNEYYLRTAISGIRDVVGFLSALFAAKMTVEVSSKRSVIREQ